MIVSWCLDVAFWEGIWARPGQEGATILIFILPWRVVRIVNSKLSRCIILGRYMGCLDVSF